MGNFSPEDSLRPAQSLQGVALEGGWTVVQRVNPPQESTGGHFSEGYIVQSSDGRQAFLKALDYSSALQSSDPARALQAMTAAYNFERDVLRQCSEKRLTRVVTAIADGKVVVQGAQAGGVVEYLIFELAQADARAWCNANTELDLVFRLQMLHHVATGLRQLHSLGIAHQDIKPSNVLVFEQQVSKVTDLGRASRKAIDGPHDGHNIAGDLSYSPPELLYGHVEADWNRRRLGCDAYLLGSMVVYLFGGMAATPLLMDELGDEFHPSAWGGTYLDVLPYVRDAFDQVVIEFAQRAPNTLKSDLDAAIRELCEPDPALRGHPKERGSVEKQFSLERYISLFNLLCYRVAASSKTERANP